MKNYVDQLFCQSCGMPLEEGQCSFGTNADGSLNKKYCSYCYANGKYTTDCTMDEMIERCVPFVVESVPNMNEEQARAMMTEFYPKLERWKKLDA